MFSRSLFSSCVVMCRENFSPLVCHFQISHTMSTHAPTEARPASTVPVAVTILRASRDSGRRKEIVNRIRSHTIKHKNLLNHPSIVTTRPSLSHSTRHLECRQNITKENLHTPPTSLRCRRAR